jgi:nicotinic acid phosphoribosyltransferase
MSKKNLALSVAQTAVASVAIFGVGAAMTVSVPATIVATLAEIAQDKVVALSRTVCRKLETYKDLETAAEVVVDGEPA